MQKKTVIASAAMALVLASGVILGGCSSASSAVAAKVNGTEISEDSVTLYIDDLRKQNSLEDNNAWAQWLVNYDYTPESFRDNVIDSLVEEKIRDQEADRLGVTVSDDDVNAQIDAMQSYYDQNSYNYEEILKNTGQTDASYRQYLKKTMTESAISATIQAPSVDSEKILEIANQFGVNGTMKYQVIVVDTEDKANTVMSRLDGGADFANLQSEFSTESTATTYDGWGTVSYITQNMATALSGASVGDVKGPIKVDEAGYFIVKIVNKLTIPEGGFTDVSQIPTDLLEQYEKNAQQQASSEEYASYIANAKEKADIVKNPMPSGLSYDVDLTGFTKNDSHEGGYIEAEPLDDGNISGNSTHGSAAGSGSEVASGTEKTE